MSKFLKKTLFWIILIVLFIGIVVFINKIIDEKRNEELKNNPNQETPKPSKNDNPPDNPEPTPPIDTENWWLTDEEIKCAYQEIRKEITDHPEIKLVDPSVVRSIQEDREISEDLKKAKIIFFPINNSENHETGDSGSHWTLLVYSKEEENFYLYDSLKDFNEHYQRQQINEKKLAENVGKELYGRESHTIVEDKQNNAQQKNRSDCGVFVIAYTQALIKRFREKGNLLDDKGAIGVREEDLIFSIAEERQKLKAAGFPKKDTSGKDYEIGDDVDYKEEEENRILEWWKREPGWETPLRREIMASWLKYLLDEQLFDLATSPDKAANSFKEFSKKVRLLSGISKIEKEKLTQVYKIKKILKVCSLPLEEYKKTKSFNGKDNFQEDKITSEESQFVRENISEKIIKEINDLYKIHFP